jgi:cellulose synthase/poly-beta-1,6-N-acetylglucosamine synthase-like glycosyltransferase
MREEASCRLRCPGAEGAPPTVRNGGGAAVQRISVVISNYNYADFVGAAIESALGLDWPDVEVVVVDDGSTDESLKVIEIYTERVTVLPEARCSVE